jgi:hypothetical protein
MVMRTFRIDLHVGLSENGRSSKEHWGHTSFEKTKVIWLAIS